MTTYVNFAPSILSPFTFQATLDGNVYTAVITWNWFGQRYYINVLDSNNNLIVSEAMVGSPNDYPINLVQGYFNSVLAFYPQQSQFVITP
jgi:hypothetical protein